MTETVIEKLQFSLSSEMADVDLLMRERMKSEKVDLIEKVAGHLINAGGKRLRPLLTIASAKLFNYQGIKHISVGSYVETTNPAFPPGS